jgi:dipeptidyl aminopeptidase/acylaminoacyl peptidase
MDRGRGFARLRNPGIEIQPSLVGDGHEAGTIVECSVRLRFGASVYEDPAVYARSSPINFIRNVKTPTFEFVGELDIECPAPQTQEFWHALKAMNVPTSIMIYPGEGHSLRDPKHTADAMERTLSWFEKYLK